MGRMLARPDDDEQVPRVRAVSVPPEPVVEWSSRATEGLLERALTAASLPVDPDAATAAAVQQASLPMLAALDAVDVAARYVPSGRSHLVGGDWYDALAIDDQRVIFSVGDVCGHGLEAAGLMAQIRNGLRALCFHGVAPDAALASTSRLLARTHRGEYATCVLAVLDRTTRALTWCRAGHPPLLRRSALATAYLGDVGGPPLGAFPEEPYVTTTAELEPGDLLVLYTDGLVERPKEPITVGLHRLRQVVSSTGHLPPLRMADELVRTLVPGPARDDVCVLTVRIH